TVFYALSAGLVVTPAQTLGAVRIRLANIRFVSIPRVPFGFNAPIRLEVDPATTRGRRLRMRAFRGTREELMATGIPDGSCRLYFTRVRTVQDGTGLL